MTKAQQSQTDRAARVLIADDHPQGVELLDAYLADTGFEIETAYDGDEALRKVRDWRPDLVLLDIMMPKISGFEVCEKVKADPELRSIKIILLTAKGQDSDREVGRLAGADDYMTKPFSPTKILERAREILEQ